MYGYVSVADLSCDVRAHLHKIPTDVDLIVGIPRSGMIPAYMVGLFLNRLVIDLDNFLVRGPVGHGQTRPVAAHVSSAFDAKHILLVDDSLATGHSMRKCLERIRAAHFRGRITTCAAIVAPSRHREVDLFFREVPYPRIFEWNAFHHPDIANACFDLDGILCVDPTDDQNDDGPCYEAFLGSAQALYRPTQRIGHIVSARLEKYRRHTERWLEQAGIQYGQLHLIDLPSAAERIRLGIHSVHKANVYIDTGATLFYESDIKQAQEIATISGKPVLCTANMSMQMPTGLHLAATIKSARWWLRGPLGRAKGWLRHQFRPPMSSTLEP
jgi:uncharacterized HAD superfamily protein/adenine/guanine phosphoribosyltransferase-like PRPP-binding protein